MKVVTSLNPKPSEDNQDIEHIPREPFTPTDQTLSSFDGLYMQFYWCTSGLWFDLINDGMTDAKLPLALCAARRFGPHISSKLVRASVLVYSSFRKERKLSYLGMQYLAQFYQSAKEAIDRESYVELAYACYAMCLYEMAYRRRFSEDFAKHANGFLISVQNMMDKCTLTAEEYKVMSRAYKMINQATHLTSSRWHFNDNWLVFAGVCLERLESATFRLLNSTEAVHPVRDPSIWIPKSHHLLRAEENVYRIYKLFLRLTTMQRSRIKEYSLDWFETVARIQYYLNALWEIISQPQIHESQTPKLFLLKDQITTFLGDKFTGQLLTLYYIFQLQYLLLVEEWSDSACVDAIKTSTAICRLYPSPHEPTYPEYEIRYIVNRGLLVAGLVIAESRIIDGI